jgi:hypothetical protein
VEREEVDRLLKSYESAVIRFSRASYGYAHYNETEEGLKELGEKVLEYQKKVKALILEGDAK